MWGALFPGQGSQAVGMGRFLHDNFQLARERFEEAGDTLKVDFRKLCFEGPESDLALTENTQPCLLLVSTVTFETVQSEIGLAVLAGAGHSIGEYAALVAAKALKFSDALRAVRVRGQAMQRAVPVGQGAMVAVIGLEDGQVAKLCSWVAESGAGLLEPANFNAPGQVVISGSKAAADWLAANFTVEIFAPEKPRVKLIPLNVSAPFHCRLMKPAEDEMSQVLSDLPFANATWPIVQNFSATETQDGSRLRTELIAQVSGAVRWTQCMRRLSELGVKSFIEFGAGKVLSGLAKKIDTSGAPTFNINSLEDFRNLEAATHKTGAQHPN